MGYNGGTQLCTALIASSHNYHRINKVFFLKDNLMTKNSKIRFRGHVAFFKKQFRPSMRFYGGMKVGKPRI